jgi:hypothetical protein
MKKILFKKILFVLLSVFIVYALLLIPESEFKIPAIPMKAFEWKRDSIWNGLEEIFRQCHSLDSLTLRTRIDRLKNRAEDLLRKVGSHNYSPSDPVFAQLRDHFFTTAASIAAEKTDAQWLLDYANRARKIVKKCSTAWNMLDSTARNTLYTTLYGMRTGCEEVLLQIDPKQFPPTAIVNEEPSATPSSSLFSSVVHSGDILVSRGGVEVSALIARSNDYQGNFSHIALMYIDEKTNVPYIIESHIERGVAISTLQDYVRDKKLRFMVLRLRNNIPQIKNDPMLPHKAASWMYSTARSRYIPYDFAMNYRDTSLMFCSEIASHAYERFGITLWNVSSGVSSPGMVSWLHAFGVRHFSSYLPSDLEYDPQVTVVAEWRDPETLFKDHLDNAVIDAMLESANAGTAISYDHWKLPLVRCVKLYCAILNYFEIPGIIPDGMSATQALKNQWLEEKHREIKNAVEKDIHLFLEKNGYTPPYWKLLQFSRASADTILKSE